MFGGGTSNDYDDIVGTCMSSSFRGTRHSKSTAKATDENLTGENWELILNMCDKVQDEGQPGYVPLSRLTKGRKIKHAQSPLGYCSYSASTGTSQSQRSALCAFISRGPFQEPGHRCSSRDCFSSIYSRTREVDHRSRMSTVPFNMFSNGMYAPRIPMTRSESALLGL